MSTDKTDLPRRTARRAPGVATAATLATALWACAAGCSQDPSEHLDGDTTDVTDMAAATLDLVTAPKSGVVINEVFPHGKDELTDPDWAELKNTGDTAVDLSGYRVRDDKTTATLPPGTRLEPGQYLVLLCDDAPDGGASMALHLPFKLGGSDELYLLQPDGNKVDGVSWDATSAPTGKSFGRLPDGAGQFTALTPTRGARNGT